MTRFSFVLIVIACIYTSTCIVLAEENAVESGTIRGEVIEATAERDPIAGVEVKIVASDGKTYTTQSNAKGEYKISGLPAGRYTMSTHKDGYASRKGKSFVIARGGEISNSIIMVKKGNINQSKIKINLQKIEFLLQRVEESVAQRYKLDKLAVAALCQSILQEVNTILKQENQNSREFTAALVGDNLGLLELLLSHPNTKRAFAKHLTETQLQDYINFTKARRQQYQQAVVQLTTAFLDQVLSLTVDQRESIAKLLLDGINEKPGLDFMNMLSSTLQWGVVNLIHDTLKISLDDTLNQTQAKIWQEIIDIVEDKYIMKDLVAAETFGLPSDKIAEKDETDADTLKSQKWILAEAILKAHTEQLGTLNKNASKRLELVAKGVIQEYIEAQNPDGKEKGKYLDGLNALMVSVMQQDIPREQAAERLESMKKALLDQKGANKRWNSGELYNITNHPLFQQTIRDVLSKDAYLKYETRIVEREILFTQASRDLIVAFMDMIVLLDNAQRKQLKMTTAQVSLPLLSEEGKQMMFIEFFIRMDSKILSAWQISVLTAGGM